MGKVGDLISKFKAKIAAIQQRLSPGKPASEKSLGPIGKFIRAFKNGSTGERLLLCLLLLFVTTTIFGAAQFALLLGNRREALKSLMTKGTERYDTMQSFLKAQTDTRHDIASTVSIDKIRINSEDRAGNPGFMSVSIWVKCDSPKTAKIVEEIYPKLHDAIVSEMQVIREAEITDEAGKSALQERMKTAMNKALPTGSIRELFFYNLVFDRVPPNSASAKR